MKAFLPNIKDATGKAPLSFYNALAANRYKGSGAGYNRGWCAYICRYKLYSKISAFMLQMLFLKNYLKLLIAVMFIAPFISRAQTLTINNINKIGITTGGGGLGGGVQAQYEIANENGQWKCYQTKLNYSGWMFREGWNGKDYTKLNSDERKFVKNVNAAALAGLLQAIKQPRPVFKPEYISFNLDDLIRKIDSAYFKSAYNRVTPRQQEEFIHLLKNKKITDKAVAFMQTNFAFDVSGYCAIHIINKNNDTLKIESHSQFDYMLPWKVNGVDSYHTGINKFLMVAMGDYYGSEKDKLSGKNVFNGIYSYVYDNYANDMFEREHMQQLSPLNVALLKQHFKLVKARRDNDEKSMVALSPLSYGNGHVLLWATIDITNSRQVMRLIHFAEDTARINFNTHNALIQQCLATKGCTVSFSTPYTFQNARYGVADFDRKGYLNKYIGTTVWGFSIKTEDKFYTEDWLVLPGNKMVLYGYYHYNVFGVKPGLIKLGDGSNAIHVCAVFDTDGKLLEDISGN